MKNKAYKVIMSTGPDIPIDADEVPEIMEAIESGSVHFAKQGVINPSFFVSIVEDEDRMEMFKRKINKNHVMVDGDKVKKITDEQRKKLEENGPAKLDNIFKDVGSDHDQIESPTEGTITHVDN